MSPRRRRFRSLAPLSAALLAAGLLAACDNPACVYGGNCAGVGGGALGGNNPAFAPGNGAWILTGAPLATGFFPDGGAIHSRTPFVVLFSESMASQTIGSSIRLFDLDGQFGEQPVPTLPPTLIGNGRVLVVLPAAALTGDHTYELRWNENALVTDLTGAALALPADLVIGALTVDSTDPVAPRVLTSWPQDRSSDQSTTTEIAVIFDRPIDDSTMNLQSFEVTVGGQAPAFNQRPTAISFLQSGFLSSDTRAYEYSNTDGSGNVVGFGTSVTVDVRMSQTAAKILAEDGSALPETVFDFTTATFAAPQSAEIVSIPTDAIGIDNLAATPTPTLDVAVTVDALGTDRIGVFLFGPSKSNPGQVETLFRDVAVSALSVPYDPLNSLATLTETELDIASSSTLPVVAYFGDGDLTLALRLERGGEFSTVKLLDIDVDTPGAQNPVLDVTRPKFTAFGSSGNESLELHSDLRDLAVVGRADERVRAAIVTETVGGASNWLPATPAQPVIGSDDTGLFVAAPVQLGLVDPATLPLPFTLDIYDRALNQTLTPTQGEFYQRGALGTVLLVPGAPLEVEVFDRRTLAPVVGADVFVHQDSGGLVTSLGAGQATDADGLVTVSSAPVGETIITVDAFGYDLLTFHGAPSDRLSIPLRRGINGPGTLSGTISSVVTNGNFTSYDRHVADSRTLTLDDPTLPAFGCAPNLPTFSNDCSYGPGPVRVGPVRALSFVAANTVGLTGANFSALGFLKAYLLEIPLAEPTPGFASTYDFRVDVLLDDVNVPAEEKAIDGPSTTLDASSVVGLDLNDLDGDPQISVRSKLASLHGTSLVGFGAALDPLGVPADTWAVRTAIPGIADPVAGPAAGDQEGQLITDGILWPADLMVRCELRDLARNRSVQRFPFASPPGSVTPIDVPLITSPAAGGGSGGVGYDLAFTGVLPAAGGLYRATLTGTGGRAWELYREAAAGVSHIRVVDLAAAGGLGLPNGPVTAVVEAWGWSYAPLDFLFSDIEREYLDYAAGGGVTYTQGP